MRFKTILTNFFLFVRVIASVDDDEVLSARLRAEREADEGNLFFEHFNGTDSDETVLGFEEALLQEEVEAVDEIKSDNCADTFREADVFSAMAEGQTAKVECFVHKADKKFNVNMVDIKTGNTILHYASNEASVSLAFLLIWKNASLDVPNLEYMTPLMIASSFGFDDIALALIDAGILMSCISPSLFLSNSLPLLIQRISSHQGQI